ncbi:hypothetical protein [Lutibacter citreus]|uniref:hypothetical protein n=1 Tax=Lutibacter citreus TaxID=2138210 RepID=UPI000DBE18D5|nr:hypothetical protein [Lutibacter citreus]
MARLNYREFYPINNTQDLFESKFKHLNTTEQNRWKNFKNRIPRSNFIKEKLKLRQSRICPICYKILNENIVVHHIDYDRLCDFDTYDKQLSPTIKEPNRELDVPNCNNCNNTNICLDKLVLIHNSCHMILHKQEGKILEKKTKIKFPKNPRNYEIVSKEWWLTKTTIDLLDLLQEILKEINSNSSTKFKVEYTKFFIKLTPENIIYFKPDNDNLKITFSYGDFGKWVKKLNEKGIKCDIYKRSSQKLTFSINRNQYSENYLIIKEIIKDCIVKFNNNDLPDYSPQMTLF